MRYRVKFFGAFVAFLVFWFVIFYPKVIPWMNDIHMEPILALIIFEVLMYLTIWTLTAAILGKDKHRHSWKIAFVLFAMYHVVDAVEPPFIVSAQGLADSNNPTALISWDYAIGSHLHNAGFSWQTVFYLVNFGVPIFLIILVMYILKPQMLGKVVREVLG